MLAKRMVHWWVSNLTWINSPYHRAQELSSITDQVKIRQWYRFDQEVCRLSVQILNTHSFFVSTSGIQQAAAVASAFRFLLHCKECIISTSSKNGNSMKHADPDSGSEWDSDDENTNTSTNESDVDEALPRAHLSSAAVDFHQLLAVIRDVDLKSSLFQVALSDIKSVSSGENDRNTVTVVDDDDEGDDWGEL